MIRGGLQDISRACGMNIPYPS